jgi:hypothetical protein
MSKVYKLIATSMYDTDNVTVEVRIADSDRVFKASIGGIITSITGEKGSFHRFFDHSGTELFFNDPDIADKKWTTESDIIVGDRLFMSVSKNEVERTINSVPQNSRILQVRSQRLALPGYISITQASRGMADFSHSFLRWHYSRNRREDEGHISDFENGGVIKTKYQEDFIYFRFEGPNTLYNFYDAGNFMWGAWSKLIRLTDNEVKRGVNWYERLQGRLGGDSEADQRAIFNGRDYF